jgi:hypothetical protein
VQEGPWVFVNESGQSLDRMIEPGERRMIASWVADCPTPEYLGGTGLYEHGEKKRPLTPQELTALLAD